MAPISMSVTLLIILFLYAPLCLARDCFLMDGANVTDAFYPCKSDLSPTEHSACCARAEDTCLSSGLCQSAGGFFFESGCTDPTWGSDDCPNLCPDNRGGWQGSATGPWEPGGIVPSWQVMVCAPNVTCCRVSPTDPSCCGDGQYETPFEVGKPVVPTTFVTDTQGGNITCPTTSAPECDNTSSDNEADAAAATNDTTGGECKETTIGAAIGASLGAALIAMVGVVWFLLMQRKKLVTTIGAYEAAQGNTYSPRKSTPTPVITSMYSAPIAEMDTMRY
ncbi:hypothetical protein BDV19DRAFT_37087 [Aspergillus venezuelensis]